MPSFVIYQVGLITFSLFTSQELFKQFFAALSKTLSFKNFSTCALVRGAFTVTVQFALLPFAVAVTVAVPSFNAVITPFSTDTTPDGATVHVTVLSVALSGASVAVSVWVSSISSVIAVLSNSMPVTGTGFAVTVTVQFALLPSAVAVIFAVPCAIADTLPVLSTVAIFVLSLSQITVLFVALSGDTVAVKVAVPSTSNEISV